MWIITIVYVAAVALLALYGANSLWLVFRYYRTRGKQPKADALTVFPQVTVQLPTFNELHVVQRLLQAVTSQDYPRNRLQIQVLDDSTDETLTVLRALVAEYQDQGVDIEVIHREERSGYKAGALAAGLPVAKGEFVAVFDADFVPPRDWLRRAVPYIVADPSVGFVQTRWGHINAPYSPLTMVQAIILDAHFGIEHPARNRSGYFMNFNGAAGLWRKKCILEVGDWSGSTLTEDLDLSYRAQIKGWRALYLSEVEAEAELPPQLAAFKNQQFRWAKGSAQCLRQLAGPILRSHYSLGIRLEALLHMSGYLCYPMMLLVLLLSLPLLWWGYPTNLPLAYLSIVSLGPPLIFIASQFVLYGQQPRGMAWWRRAAYVPLVLLFGFGMGATNAWAVIEGLVGRSNEWPRTPKFSVECRGDSWAHDPYAVRLSADVLVDLLFALYALAAVTVAYVRRLYWAMPFMLVYALGFGSVVVVTLWQSYESHRPVARKRPTRLATSPEATSDK